MNSKLLLLWAEQIKSRRAGLSQRQKLIEGKKTKPIPFRPKAFKVDELNFCYNLKGRLYLASSHPKASLVSKLV